MSEVIPSGLVCWTCGASELIAEGDVATCLSGHRQRFRRRGDCAGWVAWRLSPRPSTGPFVDPTKGRGIYANPPPGS